MKKQLLFSFMITLFLSIFIVQELQAQENFEQQIHTLTENKKDLNDSKLLHQLFKVTWVWTMTQFPEYATYTGYPGQNDRWTDYSLNAIARRQEQTKLPLSVLDKIDIAKLNAADQLNYLLFRQDIENELKGIRFKDEYMPLTQLGGVQQDVPRILTMMPTATDDDYKNIITRLQRLPLLIDQTIILMDEGLKAGVTLPQITLRNVPQQILNLKLNTPTESPLFHPFKKIADTISPEDKDSINKKILSVMQEQVVPAFRKLHSYLTKTYIPQCRETIGLSQLPDGKAWYQYRIRHYTTTEMAPAEVHKIGLNEIKRIRHEMDDIITKTGFKGNFQKFTEFLSTDPQFFFETAEQLLTAYRDIAKRADPKMATLFGKLPRMPYGILPVPAYAEKSQTTAYYQPGSPTAGRPGYFFANTYDLKSRPKWEMEALTLHEAVPGHHLQISLAQELQGVPEFRKHSHYTAFIEGWGLYSESLGEEIGLYQDPYSKFGQLTYEMWRAIRLVVDTGMHAFGWSRQRAIDFFKKNTGKAEHDITVEIDRYIVWPGQALAYKIGELKIKELRAHARKVLGEQFSMRDFHDNVLANGALPLDILETNINQWIKSYEN